ncbi:phosphoglycerate mutase [Mycena sp. CBHHK59/15]|nr:phosphoglycerate mutase [Mycena sp. CBHHK59/15]
MLTVTFIRHGESEDNLKGIWAGWKDAPLSKLGRKQAHALGQTFSNTRIDYIYASDLLRAHATGQAVLEAARTSPKPQFTSNSKLREQHFGIAEGNRWEIEMPPNKTLEQLYEEKIFPVLPGRDAKYPEGESLNDLASRAEHAIAECVVPHLATEDDVHIAIASHGLCISELVAALLRLDPDSRRDISYAGLLNTAWTRAIISVKDKSHNGLIDPSQPPHLTAQITDVNNTDHLASLEIEAESAIVEDEVQAEARAFFGGKALS